MSKVHQDLETIVKTIRSASESDVGDLVNHLREHGNLADIMIGMPDGPTAISLEIDLGHLVEKFRVGGGGVGYNGSLGDESSDHREITSQNTSHIWTNVTTDVSFISDLLVSLATSPILQKDTAWNPADSNPFRAVFIFHLEPSLLRSLFKVLLLGRHEKGSKEILQPSSRQCYSRTGVSLLESPGCSIRTEQSE